MGKKGDRARAKRQAKRATKHKRKKAERKAEEKHRSEEKSAEERAAEREWPGIDGWPNDGMSLSTDVGVAFPLTALTGDLPWANTSSITPGMARRLVRGEVIPHVQVPHPFLRAKLSACFAITDRPWDLRRLHALSESELAEATARLGLSLNRSELAAHTDGRSSAWDLGVELAARAEVQPIDGAPAAEAAGALVTVLWSRWFPDRPCQENICDDMQLSYDAAMRGDEAMAFYATIAASRALHALFPDHDLDTLDDQLPTLQRLSLWLPDTGAWMWNHAAGNLDHDEEDYLWWVRWRRGLRDDTEARCREADALGLVGRLEEGVALYEAALKEEPMNAGLYARLSDLLTMDDVPQWARALAVLDRARALGVDGRDWDLEARRAYVLGNA